MAFRINSLMSIAIERVEKRDIIHTHISLALRLGARLHRRVTIIETTRPYGYWSALQSGYLWWYHLSHHGHTYRRTPSIHSICSVSLVSSSLTRGFFYCINFIQKLAIVSYSRAVVHDSRHKSRSNNNRLTALEVAKKYRMAPQPISDIR
jgi:hypothetical protein